MVIPNQKFKYMEVKSKDIKEERIIWFEDKGGTEK